jgi:hypothetical protein
LFFIQQKLKQIMKHKWHCNKLQLKINWKKNLNANYGLKLGSRSRNWILNNFLRYLQREASQISKIRPIHVVAVALIENLQSSTYIKRCNSWSSNDSAKNQISTLKNNENISVFILSAAHCARAFKTFLVKFTFDDI